MPSQNDPSYHLAEWQAAFDKNDSRHCMPSLDGPGEMVLDIGCGAGQTLAALCPNRTSFGLDIDFPALQMGRRRLPDVQFTAARGEQLPFREAVLDLVFSRIALPYMHLPSALREIRRVLRPGGRIWLALHTYRVPLALVRQANWKGRLFFLYVCFNSALFHFTGKQVRFINGSCESFQTEAGIRRALRALGFRDIRIVCEPHFIVTAVA